MTDQKNSKTVDIYLPLDERDAPNRTVWPVAMEQLGHLVKVIEKCGWRANVLNPGKPVSSVAEGIRVVAGAKGSRFINFMAGWAYPDFSVTPMWQLPKTTPKLMLGSTIPDFPGAVGLLAAASGTAHVGLETSRLFVEHFDRHEDYADAVAEFLHTGKHEPVYPKAIEIKVTEKDRALARSVRDQLRGMVYGAVGPRSMQMWNKISDADFLRVFGIARESFDGLRLAKMAEKIDDARADRAVAFLIEKGMELKLGDDPKKHLTRDMVRFQMKAYLALLELKGQYGLDFCGVQDQLDWIEHYPATDLALGLLNNKLRPESDGTTFVTSTEADDGAAMTMQIFKLLSGGEPAGFNDLRYWDSKQGLYWFVNSGALAPYFAHGSHDSLKGSWSERQTYMYFREGGGTSSVVVKKPGVVTWARIGYKHGRMYLCAGRGMTDVPTEAQWKERSARCSPDWPHWYLKLCGRVEQKLNTNHPMTAFGDWLAPLKALAEELDLPFECYDYLTPDEVERGAKL
jgi:L-fucose isomerase-like protein